MVCYMLMIYLADGELKVLRASSQMGRQMLGHPLTLCLHSLQETPQQIVRRSSKCQWAWNMVSPAPRFLFRTESLHIPFGGHKVLSKLKVNKYCKIWNRSGSQRREWGKEAVNPGPFTIWPQCFWLFYECMRWHIGLFKAILGHAFQSYNPYEFR